MNGPDPKILISLFTTKMPFGKFKDRRIADLPTFYLEWFAGQGFPKGKLGMLLSTCYEIKTNGLEEILKEVEKRMEREK